MELKPQILLSREHMIVLRSMGMDTSDASMCWIKEPTSGAYGPVLHDEYCYEMNCLNPIPAYTLEDVMLKIKGQVTYNQIIARTHSGTGAWTYSILKDDHSELKEGILAFGNSPLEVAFDALVKMFRKAPTSIGILTNQIPQYAYGTE